MRPLTIAFALLLAPGAALACSQPANGTLELVPGLDDTEPPSMPVLLDHTLERAEVGLDETAECSDFAYLNLYLTALDDQTATEDLGYELDIVDGTVPDDLIVPLVPVTDPDGIGDALIQLIWHDADSRSEPLDFTLAIASVDLAGNTSDAAEVRIEDPGLGDLEDGVPEQDPKPVQDPETGCDTTAWSATGALDALARVVQRR